MNEFESYKIISSLYGYIVPVKIYQHCSRNGMQILNLVPGRSLNRIVTDTQTVHYNPPSPLLYKFGLYVCLCPINVKTAEPIRAQILCGT